MTVSSICISILSMLSSSTVKVHPHLCWRLLCYIWSKWWLCFGLWDSHPVETKRTVSQVNDWGLLMKVIGFGWGIVFVVFVVSFFCFGGKKQFEVHEAACSLNWIVTVKSSYGVGCTGKTTWQWSLCSQLSKWKITQGNSVVVSWWQSVNNANGSITFGVETYSTYTVLYNTARQTRSLVVTCTLLVANGGRIWPDHDCVPDVSK